MIYDYKKDTGELKLGSEMIYFTKTENSVFNELYKHFGTIVKKEKLLKLFEEKNNNSYLALIIHRINAKISEEFEVVSQYGVGYIMKEKRD